MSAFFPTAEPMPADARHWDAGDWIEFHRARPTPVPAVAATDPEARQRSVYASLLQSARSYHGLTGQHLAVYDAIAALHAALTFGIDDTAAGTPKPEKVLCIPPNAPSESTAVDLSEQFEVLIVVRITPDFSVSARVIPRTDLPDADTGLYILHWSDLRRLP